MSYLISKHSSTLGSMREHTCVQNANSIFEWYLVVTFPQIIQIPKSWSIGTTISLTPSFGAEIWPVRSRRNMQSHKKFSQCPILSPTFCVTSAQLLSPVTRPRMESVLRVVSEDYFRQKLLRSSISKWPKRGSMSHKWQYFASSMLCVRKWVSGVMARRGSRQVSNIVILAPNG